MKNKVIRTAVALLLLASMALGLCACKITIHTNKSGAAGKELQEVLEAQLENFIKQDDAAAYDAFYPGVADKTTWPEQFKQLLTYFPVTEDYSISVVNCVPYRAEDDPTMTLVFGEYLVKFDDQEFHLNVSYAKDRQQEGFQMFQIISKEEYEQNQMSSQ